VCRHNDVNDVAEVVLGMDRIDERGETHHHVQREQDDDLIELLKVILSSEVMWLNEPEDVHSYDALHHNQIDLHNKMLCDEHARHRHQGAAHQEPKRPKENPPRLSDVQVLVVCSESLFHLLVPEDCKVLSQKQGHADWIRDQHDQAQDRDQRLDHLTIVRPPQVCEVDEAADSEQRVRLLHDADRGAIEQAFAERLDRLFSSPVATDTRLEDGVQQHDKRVDDEGQRQRSQVVNNVDRSKADGVEVTTERVCWV